MIQEQEVREISKNFKTVSDSLIKLNRMLAEANVIAMGHKTLLDLEQALNHSGVFEFERKRKLRIAIRDIKANIQNYRKRTKEA